MQILKFGGSSVANSNTIKQVAEIIIAKKNTQILVVVSALGGTTDLLLHSGILAESSNEKYLDILKQLEIRHLDTTKELFPIANQSGTLSQVKKYFNEMESICEGIFRLGEFSSRSKDKLLSYGELLSSKIISGYLTAIGIQQIWVDSRELIKTNNAYGKATVDFTKTKIAAQNGINTAPSPIYIAPGFIGSDDKGFTTTLGRGGSDYSAAIFADALDADSLEIWTDVSGMMTADPKVVPNAKPIVELSYHEAMELSHFGAKVIYPPTLQPAMAKIIPVWIKNTFEPSFVGTLIQHNTPQDSGRIRGITSASQICLLSLEGSGMIGIPGFSKRLFEALAREKINVILITQGSSEHTICVGIHQNDASNAKIAIDDAFDHEIRLQMVEPVKTESNLAIIALVGDKMKSHAGISGQMFSTLGKGGINVRAIAQGSSERNISAVIFQTDVHKAVNMLHEVFFEEVKKQLNLYIVGIGNVGKRLLEQLKAQEKYLAEKKRTQIRIVGIANSKAMAFSEKGLDSQNWENILKQGETQDAEKFADWAITSNLRNSIFVDVTASPDVAKQYPKLLQKSIAVVACNKIAASAEMTQYQRLKEIAHEFNVQFLFETNVGAGLPIIGTLNDLVKSGDRINSIEAVLSGTLNFVFNHYNGTQPFAEIVRQAQFEGYTEPDPRLDLGGTDVMRKILILSRESGFTLNMEEIENIPFLPAECMEGSVEAFYDSMLHYEAHFKALYEEAHAKNCKLKFVATFKEGKASVKLSHIPPEHDFYHLYGKDNIVLFYTTRYHEQPLVIKGAGAGADVTASGVFADIMRVISQ